MASTEVLQTLTILGGLGAIVWRASKLQYGLEKSIELASKKSDDAVQTASIVNEKAIHQATEETKEGQKKLQERFERQFERLQERNAESYRTLNESLQLHLRDFDHERLNRQKSEEVIISNIEALKSQFDKELATKEQEIITLQKQSKDVMAFLEKNQGFVIRDR